MNGHAFSRIDKTSGQLGNERTSVQYLLCVKASASGVSPLSKTFEAIREHVASGEFRISDHGYDELTEDDIRVRDLVDGLADASVVEDYPDFPKGPAVLVLQSDSREQPIHAVWGIPKGGPAPAVLVTAYRPDPTRWHEGFLEQRRWARLGK